MSIVVVLVEHDRGTLAPASLEALTKGRALALQLGGTLHALTVGVDGDGLADTITAYGADVIHQAHHPLLTDYGPDAWGETLAQLATAIEPTAVLATGTDRGQEVMAQAAARLDLPMVANCGEITPKPGAWEMIRVRWGGSLLERAALDAPIKLITCTQHSLEPAPAVGQGVVRAFCPTLSPSVATTIVVDRVVVSRGVTLTTAPVVIAGGRGMESADGFGILEELAELLGGAVGCSRVATNNGWRPHADQVGQTGTRIAPEIYIACGISGAIQHWVGAMASKHILAINTDAQANMVRKADYAIIGDLHEVIPAITEAVRRTRTGD